MTVLLLLGLLSVAACVKNLPTIRYRLTVVVETPEGRRSGSSVVEIQSHISPAFPGPEAEGLRARINGEATPVLLHDGKYLFAVLKWNEQRDRFLDMILDSFSDQIPPEIESTDEDSLGKQVYRISYLRKVVGIRKVYPKFYPVIAAFYDQNDRTTMISAPAASLESIMPGYRVVEMNVEITDDPISRKVKMILPWMKYRPEGYFGPKLSGKDLINTPEYRLIGYSEFTLGDVK